MNQAQEFPGIYLHIPFCEKRCSYCDFFSTTNLKYREKFTQALIKEIRIFGEKQSSKIEIDTIYFGGGTPSLLIPWQIESILEEISKTFLIRNDSEITLEVNPGALDMKFALDYKSLGVNRISMGVQSFDDDELKILERIHSSKEAIESYEYLRQIGFDNISLDLIFGIPSQTLDKWKNNLFLIKELNPEHISSYNLIFEQGTKIEKMRKIGKIFPINEEIEEEFFIFASDYLQVNGWEHYEISNFAKKGFKSRHNSKYWKHLDYFGFGPSAHSLQGIERRWNSSNLDEYFQAIEKNVLPIESSEQLTEKDILIEKIMLGFRSDGLNLKDFKTAYDIDLIDIINKELSRFQDYICVADGKLSLKKKGYFIINEVVISLINFLKL
jgi:oxygen-independent coproporphyrinogen-3 oxidase